MAYPPQQAPPKDRAPLIASMIFVVALLAGLGVLGFVEPGFFLGDDKGGSASDDSSSKGPGGLPGGASGDAPPGGPANGPEDGPADPTISGAPADTDDSGDSSDSGGSGDSGGGDGEAFVAEFVDALNTLDATTANDMYCPDAVGGMVDYVIKKGPQLAVDTTEASDHYLKVTLTGTLGGEPLRSGKLSVQLDGPCVFTFTAA